MGIKQSTRLRLGFSQLKEHKFKYNFQDSVDPLCSCGIETESTKHFRLNCANFSIQRNTLFDELTELNINVLTINDDYIVKTLLIGHKDFDNATNKILLKATIDFIIATERFDCPLLFLFFLSRCIMEENIPGYCSVYVFFYPLCFFLVFVNFRSI